MEKLFLLAILAVFCQGVFASNSNLLPVGSESRKFLNLNLDNQHVGLRDYVGPTANKKVKAVILSFWSISCVPCRKEMPLVQAFAEKHKGDVELFFINIDKKSDMDKVRDFVTTNKLGGTILLDFYQTTAKAYGVCDGNNCSVPSLYVIDANGFVRFGVSGFDDSKNMEEELAKVAFAAPLTTPVATTSTAGVSSAAGSLPAATRFAVLHSILVGLPHDELAKKNNLTREQIIEILKDAEAAAKAKWGVQ